eukprot:3165151-Rhodomonas_salina.1
MVVDLTSLWLRARGFWLRPPSDHTDLFNSFLGNFLQVCTNLRPDHSGDFDRFDSCQSKLRLNSGPLLSCKEFSCASGKWGGGCGTSCGVTKRALLPVCHMMCHIMCQERNMM